MKKGIIFTAIFRIMGIIVFIQGFRLIGEGVYNYVDEHNQQDWASTTAYVTDISSEYLRLSNNHGRRVKYDITYQYEVDGKVYSDTLYNRSNPLIIGDKVKVKYDPESPDDSTNILSPSLHNLIVFLGFGSVFVIIGFFLSGTWALIRKIRRKGLPEEKEILMHR